MYMYIWANMYVFAKTAVSVFEINNCFGCGQL